MTSAKSSQVVNWDSGNLFLVGSIARELHLDTETKKRTLFGAMKAYSLLFKEFRFYRREGDFNVSTQSATNPQIDQHGWFPLNDAAFAVDFGVYNPRFNRVAHHLMKGSALDKNAWAIVATYLEALGRERCPFSKEFYARMVLHHNGITVTSAAAIKNVIADADEGRAMEILQGDLQQAGLMISKQNNVPDLLNATVVENRLPVPSLPIWSRFFKAFVVYNRTQTAGTVNDKIVGLALAGLTFITNRVYDY